MKKSSRRSLSIFTCVLFIISIFSTFIGPATVVNAAEDGPAAYFAGTDLTTKGAWQGTYGSDGYILFGYNGRAKIATDPSWDYEGNVVKDSDLVVKPSYLKDYNFITPAVYWALDERGWDDYVLDRPTGDTRDQYIVSAAMGEGPNNTRVYSFEVNDNEWHQFSYYAYTGWNGQTPTTPISILDANDQVLATRTISATDNKDAIYVIFNVKGSFKLKTESDLYQFGISGFFFDQGEAPTAPTAINLYASPTGTGGALSIDAPGSLESVKALVRTMNGDMDSDIVVNLRGGNYNLTAPFTLGATDSGTNGFNVIYQAYQNEEPVFDGGQAVTNWTIVDGSDGIYKATVGSNEFREIYVDDENGIRARTPNMEDPISAGPYNVAVQVKKIDANNYKYAVNTNELTSLASINDTNPVEVIWRGHWMQKIGRIESYSDDAALTTEFSKPVSAINFMQPELAGFIDRSYTDYDSDPNNEDLNYYHFENAYEFLDAAGEWYLDTNTGSDNVLYYKPTGADMTSVNVIIPVVESLLNITGTKVQPVSNVVVKGITFQYTNWTVPSNYGLVDGQSMVQIQSNNNSFVPGAVNVNNSMNMRFEGNTFTKTAAHGLLIQGVSNHNVVTGNTCTNTGAGGIYNATEESSYDTISFNVVEKFGQYYTGACGIYAMRPDHMLIDHNTVREGRYTGISIGWSWDDTETGTNCNQVQYNEIYDVMQLHADGGGIYSLGKQTNGTRYKNYIHGLKRSEYASEYPIAGIYLDGGSSFITVEDNVLENTTVDDSVHAFYARNTPNHDNVFQNNYHNNTLGFINGALGEPNHSFVPVNFTYSDSTTPGAITPFVTAQVLGTKRGAVGGWLGMKFRVGPSPVTVKQLGRWVMDGNTGKHVVKIVNIAGEDVASVEVDTQGATAGEYKYVDLTTPFELQPYTSYYILSMEDNDFFYNEDTTVTTTEVATVGNQFYSFGASFYLGNVVGANTKVVDTWPAKADAIKTSAGADAVVASPIPVPGVQIRTYEAEAGTYGGGTLGSLQSSNNASDGKLVGNLNDGGAFVKINNVNGFEGNKANIVIRYANGHLADKTLSLYVNGVDVGQVTFQQTGGWNTFQDTAPINITLNAGATNTIKLQRDDDDAPAGDIDNFTITTECDATSTEPIGNNISQGKIATQSSTTGTAIAALAVNGNTDGDVVTNISQTNSEAQAWWMVDLGANYYIDNIKIWNRTDADKDKLGDYKVIVLDETDTQVWINNQTTYPNPFTNLNTDKVAGRYVKIQLTGTNSLNLAEVQVFGTPVPIPIVPRPAGMLYEAESALLEGGTATNTNHIDYSGTAFVDGFGAEGASATFTVNAATAGDSVVNLRYANGDNAKTLSVYVNGSKVKQMSLAGTGGWDIWNNHAETLTLNAGMNTISYKHDALDDGGVNIDYITIPGAFVKGINFGRGADNADTNQSDVVTIDGNVWLSHAAAADDGMTLVTAAGTWNDPETWTPEPVGGPDGDYSKMLNGIIYSFGDYDQPIAITQTIANGTYDIYVWAVENHIDNFRSSDLSLEGEKVAKIGDMKRGQYKKYGPYSVTVVDGVLNIQMDAIKGDPTISGMAIFESGTANSAPSKPENLIEVSRTSTTVNLAWTASTDPDEGDSVTYDVYRNDEYVVTVDGVVFEDTELAANTEYTYYVKAKDNHGNVSVASEVLTITIPVSSIAITGAAITITTNQGTLQLSAEVLPANATNNTITWTVENGTGSATISASGLLTAVSNGTVTVKATANDSSGVFGTYVVTISGQEEVQNILVSNITVTGAGGASTITSKSGNLQMQIAILPFDATINTVTWTVENSTGSAIISESGLLTAVSDGTVTVKATANDSSGVVGTCVVTISGQTEVQNILVSNISVTGDSGASAITTKNGTLQMQKAALPVDATINTVTWTVEDGTGSATISASGLLTAVSDGTVTVKATANDSSAVIGTCVVTISGQTVIVTPTPTPTTSSTPTPTPTSVTSGTLNVEAKLDANGTAKVEVKAEELAAAINSAKGDTVTIVVKPVQGEKEVEVNLPTKQILAAGEKQVENIVINTGLATISIPLEVLENNISQSSSNVKLSVTKVDAASLTEEAKKTIGDNVVYDFNLSIDGNKVSKFSNDEKDLYVEIAVDYQLKPGEDKGKVVVYYINDDGKLEIVINGRYDSETGKVVFKVKHFSKYTAVYTAATFKDAKKIPWAKDGVEALAARGIIDTKTLKAEKNITRAEFIYMLINALDLIDESAKSTFSDVKVGSDYYGAIATAQKLGITKGYNGKFGVNDEISRQDMAVLTYKAALIPKENLEGKSVAFADKSEIASYAAQSVDAMQKAGIMAGVGKNRFAPKGKATVAQAAVVVYKLFELE